MTRPTGWPERLAEYIESRRDTPFEYGKHDCCHFAGGAVVAVTGIDYMAGYSYTSELGAAKLIKSAGTLDTLVSRALGEPIHPSQAGRGDVVIADLDNGSTVGVCLGDQCAFASDEGGLTFRPRMMLRAAWRIG